MTARILIVEDDRTLRETLDEALGDEGFEVQAAADAGRALDLVFGRHFDLVLLDVMLPGPSGFEILREMRERGLRTPVVLLTVRSDEHDRVLGFDLGADDYVTKPFSLRELLRRVRAVLRRTRGRAPRSEHDEPVSFSVGDATVDLAAFEVRRDGAPSTPTC